MEREEADVVIIGGAFGWKIGAFQGLRWVIADMAIQIEAARHLV